MRNIYDYLVFVSQVEPKSIEEAEQDSNWLNAMQDELNQFECNKVWTLVEKPSNLSVIGTKWVFRKNQMKIVL